jgi:hypothetical protein
MIEPTDEMLVAWRDAMKAAAAEAVRVGAPLGRSQEIARAGLAAVLAVVERDYRIEPRPPWDPPWRCTKCGSRLRGCVEVDCVDPAQCGELWCAHHTPDGAS